MLLIVIHVKRLVSIRCLKRQLLSRDNFLHGKTNYIHVCDNCVSLLFFSSVKVSNTIKVSVTVMKNGNCF